MRKFFATIINIVSATIAIVSLSILQMLYPNNTAIEILNAPNFEKTNDFNQIVQENLNDLFTYVSLKNYFELNGSFNNSLPIATSIDGSEIKNWSVQDCLDESIEHGLGIDADFNVSQDPLAKPFNKDISYCFNFIVYHPGELQNRVWSEEKFLFDFMQHLANYYRCKFYLNDNESNFKYNLTYYDKQGDVKSEHKNADIKSSNMISANTFLYIASRENIISSNIKDMYTNKFRNDIIEKNPNRGDNFILCCLIDTNYSEDDLLKQHYSEYTKNKNRCAILITTIIYSSIIFLISLILTIMFVLATKKSLDESKRLFYIIPTEFYIILYILSITALILFANWLLESPRFEKYDMSSVNINIYLLIIYSTTILLIVILSAKFANDTLMPISLKAIRDNYAENGTNISSSMFFFAIFLPVILLAILSVYLIYLFSMTGDVRMLIIGIIMLLSTISFIIYILSLHHAFNNAIKAQAKSNEMRTSLIANVSHDIKTPLTSILNYTELISEEISNPSKSMIHNLEEYSKTIVNKSHRLNDLINDLIFDSKVTSGNVKLDMVKIDLNAFISQVLTEFESRLMEKNIKTIYDNTATKVEIMADGSQLYRVFQNLFSNIYKYALENSRVYVDLESIKSKIIITIKNIQKEKIEVDPDTLKDRFVRGSKSRSTEGFGLGLSISESLIKSMNGKLEVTSIQDLFTVKLTFVAYED